MKLDALLTAIGLNQNESSIYLTLLQHGTLGVSGIAKASGVHRPAIYAALPSLQDKGLVSQRRVGKTTHYAAEPPQRLKALVDTVHEELDTVIPKLTAMRSKKTPVVRRLDGKQGVHAVFEDIANTLENGEEFYRYSSEDMHDIESVGLPKSYIEARSQKKLERLVISNPGYKSTSTVSLEETIKTVPDDSLPFDHGITQIVYGNKVAFIDYNQPIATIIENPTIAKFQRDIFKMLWRQL